MGHKSRDGWLYRIGWNLRSCSLKGWHLNWKYKQREKETEKKVELQNKGSSTFTSCYCGSYIIAFLLCSDKFSTLYPEYIFSNTIMIVWMASFSLRMNPNFLEGFQRPMKLCELWSLRYPWIYVFFNYSQPLSKVFTQPFCGEMLIHVCCTVI